MSVTHISPRDCVVMSALFTMDGEVGEVLEELGFDESPHSGWFVADVASRAGISWQAAHASLYRLYRLGYLRRELAKNGSPDMKWMYTIVGGGVTGGAG